jgi:cell wall-associated NlpC family hydrolase
VSDLGDQIVKQARYYVELETPYYHCGRNRYGLDCIGLLVVVAHDLGITDEDNVNYQPDPPPDELTRALKKYCDVLGAVHDFPGPLEPGDLCQFEILGVERHAGIYATDEQGNPTLIHAWQSIGKVVEHEFTKQWQHRIWCAYRVRE